MLCSPISTLQAIEIPDEVQFHGFLAQGFFHTSDNNLYGHSDDSVSAGLTEVGLNASYQPFAKLRFSTQGLYRRAGDLDHGSMRLDFGVADWTMLNSDTGRLGIRMGRVKQPYGLYNETRDVSFTRPSILLPEGIYFDQARSLFLSADGGSFYADQRVPYGDLHFKFNYGMTLGDNKDLGSALLTTAAQGQLKARPSLSTQLSYEINEGEYIFAVSYADLLLDYRPISGDIFSAGKIHLQPLLFSAQYNGEKWTLAAEYEYQWLDLTAFGDFLPKTTILSHSWYVQASYQLLSKLQATVRYDDLEMHYGQVEQSIYMIPSRPLPYARDWMMGLRYDITTSWMIRAEYHHVNGIAWLPIPGNTDQSTIATNWDIYGLQLSFRF